MNSSSFRVIAGIVATSVCAAMAGCAGASDSDTTGASEDALAGELVMGGGSGAYFAVEGIAPCDSSKCASYKVALVNRELQPLLKVTCPDGQRAAECQVSDIDLTALKLGAPSEARVRRLLVTKTENSLGAPRLLLVVANKQSPGVEGVQSTFAPRDAWVSDVAAGSAGGGSGAKQQTFYKVAGKCGKVSPFAGPPMHFIEKPNLSFAFSRKNVLDRLFGPPAVFTPAFTEAKCDTTGPGLILLGSLSFFFEEAESITITNAFTKLTK